MIVPIVRVAEVVAIVAIQMALIVKGAVSRAAACRAAHVAVSEGKTKGTIRFVIVWHAGVVGYEAFGDTIGVVEEAVEKRLVRAVQYRRSIWRSSQLAMGAIILVVCTV